MGRGGKRGTRRRGRAADRGSDESDEDYTVSEEEELIESEDEYVSSFDGDESEESLGDFEDEEEDGDEEELIEKKAGRAKKVIPGRKRNGVVKPKKKQQVSYRFDDCEDSDEYDTGIRTRGTKTRKKNKVSYREPEDDECDNLDEYDGGSSKGVANSRRKKKVSYREQEDEDFDDSDEYGAGKSNGVTNSRKKKKLSYKEQDDETCDDSDECDVGKSNGITNSRKKKKVSYQEPEDDDCDNFDGYDVGNGNGITISTKRKTVSYKEKDDDNYIVSDEDEDEDDDDDEFAPDEIDDDLYDEEVITERKRDKKLSRPRKKERIPRDRKRKRNSEVLGKNTRNRPGRNQGLTSKTRSKNHVEFPEPKTRLEETKLKIAGRAGRKKRSINSDSDFECSGPSDYDYTLSEKEREQVSEANEFCRKLANSLRSAAIPVKKLQEEQESIHPQIKRPGRKGKEKEEELKTETGKQVCGICLSEEGKRTVRGTLNCCSHYFCFACITEWSKVESRCPLCKQRFGTISKPGRFDLRPVVIPVPERDQVYQPSEEELRGYLNPYEDVICTECHLGGDDALMLLCDLCDSPAHTYCVGLGHEVPEGNWYCEGCRPTALDSLNPQSLNPSPCHRTNNYLSGGSSPVANVRETIDLNEAYVPETPMTQGTGLPSPRISVGDFQAFTLQGRRRIQQQIRQIIHSRMLQDNETNSTVPTLSGNSLFGSQVGRSRLLEPQHAVIPERSMASYNLPFGGQREGNDRGILPYAEGFPGRMTHFRGPVVQGQASTTSTDGSFGGFMQNDFVGINSRVSYGSGLQQVHPFSSRSNIGSDTSASTHSFKEGTVPPRTLQESLHRPF